MKKSLTGLLSFSVLISCKPNGNINNGHVADGIYKEFYPNGKVKYLANKVNDSLNGNYYTFYESGNLESINVPISEGKYYRTIFNTLGKRNDSRQPLLYMQSRDTFLSRDSLPLVVNIDIYNNVKTTLSTKIFDSSNQLVFDSSSLRPNHNTPLERQAFFYRLKLNKGEYKCVSIASYVDIASNTTLEVDTFTLHLLGKE